MAPQTPHGLCPLSAFAGARALVVDDEIPIASVLCRTLERAGMLVDVAYSGRAALDLLMGGRYDVVLCDLRMPDMGGPELFARLCEEMPEVARRIVFLTGDVASEGSVAFLQGLGRRFLIKPFQLCEVVAAADEVLAASSRAVSA